MYRKVKNKETTIKKEQEELNQVKNQKTMSQQILTRSRVREFNKNKKRNAWLNKAIIIVVILLAITIYAVTKW